MCVCVCPSITIYQFEQMPDPIIYGYMLLSANVFSQCLLFRNSTCNMLQTEIFTTNCSLSWLWVFYVRVSVNLVKAKRCDVWVNRVQLLSIQISKSNIYPMKVLHNASRTGYMNRNGLVCLIPIIQFQSDEQMRNVHVHIMITIDKKNFSKYLRISM